MVAFNLQSDPELLDLVRWFHLDLIDDSSHVRQPIIQIDPGCIGLITGASGSGKTSLLRQIMQSIDHESLVFFDAICIPDRPCARCFDGASIDDSLGLLSSVGLAEAATFLKFPHELSEGQRWRLRLACALHRARQSKKNIWIIADEFAALLDRVTASIVARTLRLLVDRHNQNGCAKIGAILATGHDDLQSALKPDLIINCDFGARTVHRKRSNQRMNR